MATVRISAKLLEDVKNKISEVSHSVHEATIEPRNPMNRTEFTDGFINVVMLHVWKGYEHLRTVVPSSWLKKTERLDVRIGDSPEYQLRGSFKLPPDIKGYGGSYVDIRLSVEDTPFEIAQLLRDHGRLEEAHKQKFLSVREKVISFLKSCKSLNDAVKQYPDVALYLPQGVKNTLEEVSQRKVREKKEQIAAASQGLSEEDRNLLTATGVVGAIYNTK